MSRLESLQTPELNRLDGYLHAAQHIFTKGQYEVTLNAACFKVLDSTITDEDVLLAAYPDGFNRIEHRVECSAVQMISNVNQTLIISREMWRPIHSNIAEIIEDNLREGYWQHVKACFDYVHARIFELGWDVPYTNIGNGFTYILYAPDKSKCLFLIGTVSD